MRYERLQEVVTKGRLVLETKHFPGDIIERIKEPRLRKDISKQIFKVDKQLKDLKPAEKQWRIKLLKVQYAFTDYLSAGDKYRPTGVLLIFLGVVTAFLSIVGLNENLPYGVVSVIQGIVIFVISFSYNTQLATLKLVSLVLLLMVVLEPVILGVPNPYIQYFYMDNVFQTRLTGVVAMFNFSTPYVYLIAKLTCAILILNYARQRDKYLRLRLELEERLGQ